MAVPITVFFSGLGTQAWAAPSNGRIVGFGASSQAGLSWNPSRVAADWTAPGSNLIAGQDIYFAALAGIFSPLDIPFSAGEVIYIASKAAGTAFIFVNYEN